VQGRVIVARERGNPAGAAILVVGCIDGNEPAGIAIVHRLEALAPPPAAALWTIADLNPDGVHANTRQNARGVDLNRNFPFRWQPIGVRGDPEFSGARALSEPESRFAYQLILQVKPRITIWFHQPLGLVDESGGDPAVERRFAALAGLPLVRLPRYPGSASGWQNHRLPRTTAFVVELPPGRASARDVARWAAAVHGLLPSLSSGR
jgi:protein MpaA